MKLNNSEKHPRLLQQSGAIIIIEAITSSDGQWYSVNRDSPCAAWLGGCEVGQTTAGEVQRRGRDLDELYGKVVGKDGARRAKCKISMNEEREKCLRFLY